jgi:hypothetical protein
MIVRFCPMENPGILCYIIVVLQVFAVAIPAVGGLDPLVESRDHHRKKQHVQRERLLSSTLDMMEKLAPAASDAPRPAVLHGLVSLYADSLRTCFAFNGGISQQQDSRDALMALASAGRHIANPNASFEVPLDADLSALIGQEASTLRSACGAFAGLSDSNLSRSLSCESCGQMRVTLDMSATVNVQAGDGLFEVLKSPYFDQTLAGQSSERVERKCKCGATHSLVRDRLADASHILVISFCRTVPGKAHQVRDNSPASMPVSLSVPFANGSEFEYVLSSAILHHRDSVVAKADPTSWQDQRSSRSSSGAGHYTSLHRRRSDGKFIQMNDGVEPREVDLNCCARLVSQLVYLRADKLPRLSRDDVLRIEAGFFPEVPRASHPVAEPDARSASFGRIMSVEPDGYYKVSFVGNSGTYRVSPAAAELRQSPRTWRSVVAEAADPSPPPLPPVVPGMTGEEEDDEDSIGPPSLLGESENPPVTGGVEVLSPPLVDSDTGPPGDAPQAPPGARSDVSSASPLDAIPWDELMRFQTRSKSRIPPKFFTVLADIYSRLLTAASSGSEGACKRLHLFNVLAMAQPSRGGKGKKKGKKKRKSKHCFATYMSDCRLAFSPDTSNGSTKFDDVAIAALYARRRGLRSSRGAASVSADPAQTDAKAVRRAAAHASFGEWGKAASTLVRTESAPVNNENAAILAKKHPNPLPVPGGAPLSVVDPPSDEEVVVEPEPALKKDLAAKLKGIDLEEMILNVVRGISSTTDPGAGSLPVRTFKQLMENSSVLTSYTAYIRRCWLSAGLAAGGREHLVGGNLFAIIKRAGGLRPITCGLLDRRITAKVACRLLKPGLDDQFLPEQRGVGASDGCTRIVSQLRDVMGRHTDDPDFVIALIDAENAFNNISRAGFRKLVREREPWLAPFVDMCYEDPSILRYGDLSISSQEGTQQGDPLGPYLFSIVLQPIIDEIASKVPGLAFHAWFLDDGTFAGSAADVRAAIAILDSELARACGFFRNPVKCELIYLNAEAANVTVPLAPADAEQQHAQPEPDVAPEPGMISLGEAAGIPQANIRFDGNFVLLGLPIGTPRFSADFILKHAVVKNARVLERAQLIDDWQTEAGIYRSTAGCCKVVHLMRGVPPSPPVTAALTEVSKANRNAWSSRGVSIDNLQWAQMQLNVSIGGMAARNPATHHFGAFFAATTAAMRLDGWRCEDAFLQPVVDTINESINPDCSVLVHKVRHAMDMGLVDFLGEPVPDATFVPASLDPGAAHRTQRELSLWLDYSDLSRIRDTVILTCDDGGNEGTDYKKMHLALSRLRQLQADHAGDWLFGVPNPEYGTRLTSAEFSTAMRIRLGSPVFVVAGHVCPVCTLSCERKKQADAAAPAGSPPKTRRGSGVVDAGGYHALCSCPHGGDSNRRHNAIAKTIADFTTRAGFKTNLEVNVLGINGERPADLQVVGGESRSGNDVIIDVAVTHGGQQHKKVYRRINDFAAMSDPDAVAASYAAMKDGRYKVGLEIDGARRTFLPICFSHYGAMNKRAVSYLTSVAKTLGCKSGRRDGVARAISSLFTKISVSLQRSNSNMVSRRRSVDVVQSEYRCLMAGAPLPRCSLMAGAPVPRGSPPAALSAMCV